MREAKSSIAKEGGKAGLDKSWDAMCVEAAEDRQTQEDN